MTRRRWIASALAMMTGCGVLTSVASPSPAAALLDLERPRCASAASDGGDWSSMNHDLRNTRSQPDEDLIDVASAGELEPAWSFDGASVGATGGLPRRAR
jgi:hypothetical protein